MAIRSYKGSTELGAALKSRRHEMGLTIEEAARAAGVGSETWRRYESGGSIRVDKIQGVCRALRWKKLPNSDASAESKESEDWFSSPKEEFDDSYSEWLEEMYGEACARTFAFGCDLIRDDITNDLQALSKHPLNTHIGEIRGFLEGLLPARWLPKYNYEFLFRLRCSVETIRARLIRPSGTFPLTLSVAEDLALHLIMESGFTSADVYGCNAADNWYEWEYELNGEDDQVIEVLYSEIEDIPPESIFHFDRWFEHNYYNNSDSAKSTS